MRSIYRKLSLTTLAVLDVTEYYDRGYIITRINVPVAHRGKGHASALLRECCDEADREGTTLWLEIAESDGLNYNQLEAWYKRYGFRGFGIYRRRPKSALCTSKETHP